MGESYGKYRYPDIEATYNNTIIQLFGFGAKDINDLITNTIGACLGYGIYKMLNRVIPESWNTRIRVEGSQFGRRSV